MFENYVLQMASSSTYAFFHCHYAFKKSPFFCVTLCVLHALQNATLSHSAEHATQFFFSWISSIFVGFFKSSRSFVSSCTNQPISSSQFLDKQAGYNNQETHKKYLYFSATLSLLQAVKFVSSPKFQNIYTQFYLHLNAW